MTIQLKTVQVEIKDCAVQREEFNQLPDKATGPATFALVEGGTKVTIEWSVDRCPIGKLRLTLDVDDLRETVRLLSVARPRAVPVLGPSGE
jgi:hypothetical protein